MSLEAGTSPDEIVTRLRRERATAILRARDRRIAASLMEAAVRAGFRALEFTLTTPGAYDLIREFAARGELCVGAGTVLRVEEAREAALAGAQFLVSPVLDEQVVAAARALGVAVMPGTSTPSEMWRAHRLGAELCKLFPAPAGGPAAVRSILAPMPFLRVVPTNGVHADNAAAYLEAGAWAVGFVDALFEPEALARGDAARVEARAAELLAALGPAES